MQFCRSGARTYGSLKLVHVHRGASLRRCARDEPRGARLCAVKTEVARINKKQGRVSKDEVYMAYGFTPDAQPK